jgi:hypothetical protein
MIAQKPEQNFCKTEIIFLTQNQRGPDRNSVNSANDSHFEIWADGGEKEMRRIVLALLLLRCGAALAGDRVRRGLGLCNSRSTKFCLQVAG